MQAYINIQMALTAVNNDIQCLVSILIHLSFKNWHNELKIMLVSYCKFELTGWVWIQNLQFGNYKFPSKLKIYNVTLEKSISNASLRTVILFWYYFFNTFTLSQYTKDKIKGIDFTYIVYKKKLNSLINLA